MPSCISGPDVLQELGRINIAGSLLDIRMGYLWHHLDRTVPEEKARKSLGSVQCEKVKKLAQERLIGPMQAQVLAAVEAAEAARFRRNEIVHQGWLLRGPNATHAWGDIFSVPLEQQAAYIEDWEREAKPSDDWLQVPRDSVEVVPAQALDELRQVSEPWSQLRPSSRFSPDSLQVPAAPARPGATSVPEITATATGLPRVEQALEIPRSRATHLLHLR